MSDPKKDVKKDSKKKSEVAHESGKRKMAYARTTIKEGTGVVRINSKSLDIYGDDLTQLRIREPFAIAKGIVDSNKIDITIKVNGGGVSGQIDAIRTSISRALVTYAVKIKKDEELRERFVSHDRSLISGDSRRTEPHKPSKSSKGPRAKRQKSYR
jgi:small subunit ribosomal protein S9